MRRTVLACVVLVAAFTGLSARLVYIQITKHDEYARLAMIHRSYKQRLPSYRGWILDAKGEPLVVNYPTQDLIADRNVIRDLNTCVRGMAHAHGLKPKDYRSLYGDEEIRQQYAARLAKVVDGIVGESAAEKVRSMAQKESDRYSVPLARKLDIEVAMELEKTMLDERLKGIQFEDSIKRSYMNPESLGHVLGWMNYDGEGVAGIEKELDDTLRGTDGSRVAERNGRRVEIPMFRGETIAPLDGKNVHLTIHSRLQTMVEAALKRAVSLHNPEKATAVFMDPETGNILAMANWPDFNLETRKGNRRNFAVTDRYEPGSTFKVISMAACYDSGAVAPGDIIDCETAPWRDQVLGITLRDHHYYSKQTTGMVLAKSSNIGTYKMVKELGKETLYKYIRDFGFGSPTGIALTGEVSGLVHNPNSRFWSKTSLSRVGIGYEVDVTPLQMVNALCAVANGGVLMQPQIVSKITDANNEP
ncbi:MAG: peptidoglycan D,D-transpeptidase FtsI family protein, partial [Verrucomicrobiales bacterium]